MKKPGNELEQPELKGQPNEVLKMQAPDPHPPPSTLLDAHSNLLVELATTRELIVGRLDQMSARISNLEVKTDAIFDEIQEIRVFVHFIPTTRPPSS